MLIDFSNTDELEAYFQDNYEILIEKKDGARAYRLIGAELPEPFSSTINKSPGTGSRLLKRYEVEKNSVPLFLDCF